MDSWRRPKHLRGKEFSEVVGLADGGDGMDVGHTAVAFAWNCSRRAEGAGLLHGHDGGGVTADDCSEGAFDALCLSDACWGVYDAGVEEARITGLAAALERIVGLMFGLSLVIFPLFLHALLEWKYPGSRAQLLQRI